ncbi:MAG: hypothetical protein GFH27_549305n20 [Chloroflexi bacterium AL-W]|nr:hypothetical protein [Chloroflexi bacterium AL-N1]NOK69266.1 hypothetical protein [Chloroflexi bacterium AL-N10]NOK76327.1 hypothetical protein [Chloroflexi bacterium AL-N5]NOK83444.1 hypothetical protein [Chloroflexi bacterium AL-W]NOK91104.1 hypothetical protein [Chloroflexi bacterium AL-N15]
MVSLSIYAYAIKRALRACAPEGVLIGMGMNDTERRPATATTMPHHLGWLLLSLIGGGLAAIAVVGLIAGKLGIPLTTPFLLFAASIGIAPRLWLLLRGRFRTRWNELGVVVLAFSAVVGIGAMLAWPTLLPIGTSGDAVLHTIHANWIYDRNALPQSDDRTWEYLGEMAVYPPGVALIVVATSKSTGQTPLDVIYPLVVFVGGMSVALAVVLAASTRATPLRRWYTPLLLVVPLLILAHRGYTVNAYMDQSFYPMVFGVFWVLLAGCWLIVEPQHNRMAILQLALVIMALVATYPLWAPIPAMFAAIVLLISAAPWRRKLVDVALAVGPGVLLGVVVMLPRLSTGIALLEHEGTVAPPQLVDLIPLWLALPVGGLVALSRTGRLLLTFIGVALLHMLALVLAAQLGISAVYHSHKVLFVIVPLSAAIVGAALLHMDRIRPPIWQPVAIVALGLVLLVTNSFQVVPLPAYHPLSEDMIAATRWIEATYPDEVEDVIAVNSEPGPQPYWLQVGLLGQKREIEHTLLAIAPPTTESWIVHEEHPNLAIAANLQQPPPGAAIAAQFGSVAVLERLDSFDIAELNPLIIHYRTFWEDERLKTAIELLQPVVGPLPVLELQLFHDEALITTFDLQPDPQRNRMQYLGADLFPTTLEGAGYINADSYPTFAPPEQQPIGAFSLKLRLQHNGYALDERLLAMFERTPAGTFEQMAPHSGELIYLRNTNLDAPLQDTAIRFEQALSLTGWSAPSETHAGIPIEVHLRWQNEESLEQSLHMAVQLVDTDGRLLADDTAYPQQGFYPTWRWEAGEHVIDRRMLWLDPSIPPGTYELVVRVRESNTPLEWLAATDDGIARIGALTIIE